MSKNYLIHGVALSEPQIIKFYKYQQKQKINMQKHSPASRRRIVMRFLRIKTTMFK
jgi:hypothetical protein